MSGENPEEIIAGLARLVHDLERRFKIRTEFVPQAITWINRKGWKDDAPDMGPMPPPSGGPMGFYGAAAAVRARNEGDSR